MTASLDHTPNMLDFDTFATVNTCNQNGVPCLPVTAIVADFRSRVMEYNEGSRYAHHHMEEHVRIIVLEKLGLRTELVTDVDTKKQ